MRRWMMPRALCARLLTRAPTQTIAGPLVVALVFALGTAMPAVAQQKPKGPPPVQVSVDAVTVEALTSTVPIIGRLVARQAGVVAARVNAPVGEVRVQVGDRVKAGDVIAMLVDDVLKSRFELQKGEAQQYAAAVKTAKARTQLRRQELRRLERLRESAAFSQARLEDKRQEVVVAESEAAEAEARLVSARADLKLTRIDLSNAVVRAPYSGVVAKRHTEAGTYVNTGDPVVSLIDDIHLEVEADVPVNRIAGLTPGTAVAFRMADGRRLTATVRAVVPDENPQTRTRTVRFVPERLTAVPNLAANQSVTVEVPASEGGQVVTVHKDSVLNRQGARLVYVSQNGKAVARPVQLGDAVGNRFIVVSGLKPGDLVIVRGNERLRPGQPVIHDGMAGEGKAPPGTAKTPGTDKG